VLYAISDALTALADHSMKPSLSQTNTYGLLVEAFQRIGPRELRREWIQFHGMKGIGGRALNSLNGWNDIRNALFEGLRERPLSLGELDSNGVPMDSKNRHLYETMQKRSQGHSMLVPIGVMISGGVDTAGFDQHSSLLQIAREIGGGWFAGVRGYCWVVQTKPRIHNLVTILPDEGRSDFSHD
jgi:hypothetical protein